MRSVAMRQGDFSVRLPMNGGGLFAEVSLAFNSVAEQNEALVRELGRVARSVGLEGTVGDRASLGATSGSWAAGTGAVNYLIGAMAFPTSEAVRTLSLVAEGAIAHRHHASVLALFMLAMLFAGMIVAIVISVAVPIVVTLHINLPRRLPHEAAGDR
jgi:hypothetical protein